MFRFVKIISVVTINIINLGIVPNYVLALTTYSEIPTSSLTSIYFSLSSFRDSKNPNISDSLLADNSAASLGQQIDAKAINTLLNSNEAYYIFGGIPLWKHLSDEKKYQFAQSICNSQGSASDLVVVVIDSLDGVRSTRNHLESAAIILASMHTLCPDRYRQ